MYPERDTFDFSRGHETKNQPMAVPVLSESLRIWRVIVDLPF